MARTYQADDYSDERIKSERIFGAEACRQVYELRPDDIVKAYVRKGEEGRFKELLANMARDRLGYKLIPEEELRKVAQTEHHEGICMLVRKREKVDLNSWLATLGESKGVLFLDGVDNPHNIGGILRSAHYFGLTHVVLNSKTNYTLSGSLARISEGAVEHQYILQNFDLLTLHKKLREEGFKFLISTTSSDTGIPELEKMPEKWVLVVGSEGQGVSEAVMKVGDFAIHIEAGSTLQSLNVSVATGILLYECTKGA